MNDFLLCLHQIIEPPELLDHVQIQVVDMYLQHSNLQNQPA